MTARATSFEIAGRRDGRWTIEATRAAESEAVALARALLAEGGYEAVRVLRAREIGARVAYESAVFEAARPAGATVPVRLAASHERDAWCGEIEDLYGARSRRAIGQMLRQFLDQVGITPGELLHHPRHARRLEEAGTLLAAAVHATARARAAALGESTAASLRALDALIAEALRRAVVARADAAHPLPDAHGIDAFVAAATARGPDAAAIRHAIHHGLARALEGAPTLLARLAAALAWGTEATTPAAAAAIDALVADCLGAGTVLGELLGAQPNRAAALRFAVALARGEAVPPPPRAASWYGDFARFVAAHPAPETRAVLFARVERELAGDRPLARGGAIEEAEALKALAGALQDETSGGYAGGAAVVAAMLRRWRRLDQPGGFGDLEPPEGTPLARAGALIDGVDRAFGDMRKRAVATLLLDALAEMPVDARAALRPRAQAIAASPLHEAARFALLRALAIGG
jgi:hypothetical protein